MLNLWVVSLNKQRVSFSLSLSKRKINDRASLPTALRRAVIKKMTVLVTASTSFAQVPKIAQFYYQGIPFRDADNQPNLKTTAGYTNSNSNTGLHWILFISRLTRQKWEEALPCDCTAQAIVFNPGTLESSWKSWIWLKHTQKLHSSRVMRNVPITRQVCCRGLSPLLTRSLCRQLPTPRALLPDSWGTSSKLHFPVRSVEQSSSGLLWLQRTWKEFSSLGCAVSGVPPWIASSQRGFPGPTSQKTFTESTPPAWQGAQLRIYVLLKQHH